MVKRDWVLTRQILALLSGTFNGYKAHERHAPLWFAMIVAVVTAVAIDTMFWVARKRLALTKKT